MRLAMRFGAMRLPIALGSVVAIAACTAAPASSPDQPPSVTAAASASASAPPDEPTTFTSEAYGYTLTLPAGWTATQAEGSWDPDVMPYPRQPGIDSFRGPAGLRGLMTSRPLAPSEDLDTATDALITQLTEDPICGEPLERADVTVADAPARLVRYHCVDGFDVFNVATVREGALYVFGYIAAEGDADGARAAVDAILASISFQD